MNDLEIGTIMTSTTFAHFVIGIAQLLEQPDDQPTTYPEPLLHSLHRLALNERITLPQTLYGLRQMCQQPVSTWCYPELLAGFDGGTSLIEEGMLSETAVTFLETLQTNDTHLNQTLQQLERAFDNLRFKKLYQRLKEAHQAGSPYAQTEYTRLRQFVIQNPYTSFIKLQKTFRGATYLTTADVQDLYQHTHEIAPTLQTDPKTPIMQNCPRCGIVQVRYGLPQSIKPSVCGNSCPKHRGQWQTIALNDNPLILRPGIQRRTLIPGVPELDLYQTVCDLQEKHPTKIKSVDLWPELDTYDLAIHFTNTTVWVVDVKDHRDPYRLGKNLRELSHTLDWTAAFIVYPLMREGQIGYRQAARDAAQHLRQTRIVNSQQFKRGLQNFLKNMETP
jgi:hypothetical protein